MFSLFSAGVLAVPCADLTNKAPDCCEKIWCPTVKQWRLHGCNITSPTLNELNYPF